MSSGKWRIFCLGLNVSATNLRSQPDMGLDKITWELTSQLMHCTTVLATTGYVNLITTRLSIIPMGILFTNKCPKIQGLNLLQEIGHLYMYFGAYLNDNNSFAPGTYHYNLELVIFMLLSRIDI